jgi:hypothetical protein
VDSARGRREISDNARDGAVHARVDDDDLVGRGLARSERLEALSNELRTADRWKDDGCRRRHNGHGK